MNKKFYVTLEYDAHRTVTVEAESEEEAFEKACQTDFKSLNDFDSIELNPDYYETEEAPAEPEPNPSGSRDNLVVKDFYCPDGIEEIHDSMQLDSCQELLSIEGTVGNLSFEDKVIVRGHVRVIFRDQIYKAASKMPEELIRCYAEGKDPEEVAKSDGGKYETPYYCDENNWLSEEVVLRDKDGEIVYENDYVIDPPDDNTREGWKNYLLQTVREAIATLEEED